VTDSRIEKFAKVLVEHSARIKPGDRVLIEATTAAEPLVRELFLQILEKGGHPHPLIALPGMTFFGQEELLVRYGNDKQLNFVPSFYKLAYDQFESRIRIHSAVNTRALTNIDPTRVQRRSKAIGVITETQMRRGAEGSFKWVTTQFPTEAYAMEASMSLSEYEDFLYGACHADAKDPIAFWKDVEKKQKKIVEWLDGRNQVKVQGPNVELSLSIKGRKFMNSYGTHNMPDGEVFTGPVEDSVNGWVRFTYPALYGVVLVEGVELQFTNGKVSQASATSNQDYLFQMLESDPGARYLGEFAIGLNFEIDRFTRNILFDEKIGGTFHMALGAGYPETGAKNRSSIHWDMICDMRQDAEIVIDGDLFYKNGQVVIK
jgi:aminopeptidase